jgi:hypothetical protein
MKRSMEFCISLATVLAISLSTAGTAAAQTNTVFGTGALAGPSSPNLNDSAFGFKALNANTSGFNKLSEPMASEAILPAKPIPLAEPARSRATPPATTIPPADWEPLIRIPPVSTILPAAS